jgi:16S rRNA (cytosine967-C5)-methyltransferase
MEFPQVKILNNLATINSRRVAFKILRKNHSSNHQLNDDIYDELHNKTLSDLDIRFITEMVQGTTRMKSRADYELSRLYKGKYSKLEISLKIILRMGYYQIRYMDKVPDYASVSATVNLAKKIKGQFSGITNAILRKLSDSKIQPPEHDAKIDDISKWMSHPSYLVEKWQSTWGIKKSNRLMEWNNTRPVLWFRRNQNIISSDRLHDSIIEMNFLPNYFQEDTRYLNIDKPSELLASQLFTDGYLYVQNPFSGLVVKLLDLKEGDQVIDACAAPGGKTTDMAQQVGKSGTVWAYDINSGRLDDIAQNSSKIGLANINAQLMDSTVGSFPKCDKYLLDVPCSGTGVMSKRADLRWRRQKSHIPEFADLQYKLLKNCASQMTANCILVYSTCTLEPEENWENINRFLNTHKDFSIDQADKYISKQFTDESGALNTFPPDHNIDGGFAVRLRKHD